MKEAIYPAFFILLSLFSCKKDPLPSDFYFSFTADGVEVTRYSLQYNADNLVDSLLTLTFSVDDKELYFIIHEYDEEGTYEDAFMRYSDDTNDYYGTGDVIIDEIDPKVFIHGTFHGEATLLGGSQQVLIENGEFKQKYDEM